MTTLAKKIADEALLLPREDRAELVDQLLQSLNVPTQKDINKLWVMEVEERVKEYEEGSVDAIDGEQVFREIREKFNR